MRKKADRGFTYKLEEIYGARHTLIPRGWANPDNVGNVESSHALIEGEFYDLEDFTGPEDFLAKAEKLGPRRTGAHLSNFAIQAPGKRPFDVHNSDDIMAKKIRDMRTQWVKDKVIRHT